MDSNEIDRQLIRDYLRGNYTASQLNRIKEYLSEARYRESLDKFLLEEWQAITQGMQPEMPGIDAAYQKFQSRYKKAPAPVHRIAQRRLWRYAGVAAMVISALFAARLVRPWLSGRSNPVAAGQWVVFHNEPGKRNKILLPDSSILYLGSAGTIKYNTDYNNTNRRLVLEGEAYFMVKHRGRQPFTVVTGDISTIDIGTEFNIRYYPGQAAVAVAVAKGNVEVRKTNAGNDTRLAAIGQGQQLQYDSLTSQAVVSNLGDTGLVGAWRRGVLSFRKRPLKEVTDELERYYGVSIRYTNAAAGDILITTLLNNTTQKDAINIVTLTAGIHYTREGKTILLR